MESRLSELIKAGKEQQKAIRLLLQGAVGRNPPLSTEELCWATTRIVDFDTALSLVVEEQDPQEKKRCSVCGEVMVNQINPPKMCYQCEVRGVPPSGSPPSGLAAARSRDGDVASQPLQAAHAVPQDPLGTALWPTLKIMIEQAAIDYGTEPFGDGDVTFNRDKHDQFISVMAYVIESTNILHRSPRFAAPFAPTTDTEQK